MEDAIEEGEVRAGGVSNFGVKHVSISFLPVRGEYLLMIVLHLVAGVARLESEGRTGGQPDRSPSFQYEDGYHVFLPAERDCGGGIRTACSRDENQTSEDRGVE